MTYFRQPSIYPRRPMALAALIAVGLSLQACGGGEAISAVTDSLAITEAGRKAGKGPSSTTSGTTTTTTSSGTSTTTTTTSTTTTTTSTSSPTTSTTSTGGTTSTTTGPVTLPAVSVSIDGTAATATYLDTLTTRSGNWQLHSLGRFADVDAYLMRLESKPDFARFMACRRTFTKESGDTTALSVLNSNVVLTSATGTWSWTVGVAQGACRIVQNMDPVSPNPQWLRDAVTARRLPSYSRTRAWFPSQLQVLSLDSRRGAYDPTSFGPIPGAATTVPTATSNYVGVTSAQGGEYVSSRGFLHDIDAKVVDAALNGEDSRIATTWDQFIQYTWYSLSQPQGAVWSGQLHTTVDPQFPQAGETGWETPLWTSPKPEIRSMTEVTGWTRDVAHLENTGFVHWILTEDPVAGLLVQRQAAYALASFYENYRVSTDTTYKVLTDQERGIYNALSALWKSRDISRSVKSTAGTMIWDANRAQKQAADAISYLDARMVAPMRTAVPGTSTAYARSIAGVVFSSTWDEAMDTPAGQLTMSMGSKFELAQYGKEPLYLWSLDGNATVKAWFEIASRFTATRLVDIGGAAGVELCTGIKGSSFPLKISGSTPPFSDRAGWAAWVNTQCPAANRANFDGAYVHTATQMEGLLLMARAVGITGLDGAIDRVQVLKAATTSPLGLPTLQLQKHLAGP